MDLQKIVRKSLIPMFYKEAQLGRSIGRKNIKFKKELYKGISRLLKKLDNHSLTNQHIRNEIKRISKSSHVTIGQAQKAINVYLKYYCILTSKSQKVIKELDCPLDSSIMKTFKTKSLKKQHLKNMKDFNEYEKWQKHLYEKGSGIRLQPDIKTYDKKRIKKFLT